MSRVESVSESPARGQSETDSVVGQSLRLSEGDVSHRQHSIGRSISLHLLPGVAITIFYVVVAPIVISWGFPPIFALLLAIPLVLVPIQLGYLLNYAKRTTGKFSLRESIFYRERLTWTKTAMLAIPLLLWGIVVFIVVARIEPTLVGLFSSFPEWFTSPFALDTVSNSPNAVLVVLLIFLLLFNGFVGPIVEELYFRGHLLPAIDRLGGWAPVANAVLFSLYHFWTPWQNPARILALLPLVYFVWRKRSMQLSIVVHVAINVAGVVGLIAAVVG